MFFLIEKNYDSIEAAIITDVIKKHRLSHEYEFITSADFYTTYDDEETFSSITRIKSVEEFPDRYRSAIPIGNMSFVRRFLQIFHGIEFEYAIEIPEVLRTDEFLKRKYSIVPMACVPREGKFFIKDATQQKYLKYKGYLENYITDDMFEPPFSECDSSARFKEDHLYQVSEVVNVQSEYRVYVLNGEINSNTFFAGNPLMFPDGALIKKAVELYSKQPDAPKSFSLDVMVTDRGTAITEVHNFMCLGLYSVDWDDELLYAYRDGLNYVLNHNRETTLFSNF